MLFIGDPSLQRRLHFGVKFTGVEKSILLIENKFN